MSSRGRDCAICGSGNKSLLWELKLELPKEVKLPRKYRIAVCDDCGFVYADTKASQKDYDRYYGENNIYEVGASSSELDKYRGIFEFLSNYWGKDKHSFYLGASSI